MPELEPLYDQDVKDAESGEDAAITRARRRRQAGGRPGRRHLEALAQEVFPL
jgi:hypothetical protein